MTSRLAFVLAAGALCAAACVFSIDPDQGRFSCATDADCGAKSECRPQAAGGGRCYPVGQCVPEACDGADNDCDGVVDNGFDLHSDTANCGACGRSCGTSGAVCRAGACLETDCADGLDDDGNGQADCADSACVGVRCGAGLECSAPALADGGTLGPVPPSACVAAEQDCGNGVDDDGDGRTDCADSDCDAQACADGKVCTAGACPP